MSFSGFFSGEFIYKLKNTIECKKCARTQGLLGTYAHFYMKLTLFLDIMFDGKLVLVQIKVRSRKLAYINAQSKDMQYCKLNFQKKLSKKVTFSTVK